MSSLFDNSLCVIPFFFISSVILLSILLIFVLLFLLFSQILKNAQFAIDKLSDFCYTITEHTLSLQFSGVNMWVLCLMRKPVGYAYLKSNRNGFPHWTPNISEAMRFRTRRDAYEACWGHSNIIAKKV